MTYTTGLVVQGDDGNNNLTVKVDKQPGGDTLIYNVIDAGAGDDKLDVRSLPDENLFEKYGTQLFGEDGNDHLKGWKGTDTLSGGTGDDLIETYAGHDVIDGGDGTDKLMAGSSFLKQDHLSITGIEKLEIDGIATIGDLDLAQFESVSRYAATSLTFADKAVVEDVHFVGSGWQLQGKSFDDLFDVSNSRATFTISGGDGNDVIVGSKNSDELNGQDGNDTLTGGSHNDSIFGANGNDVINGGGGNDLVDDNYGTNTIHGGGGDDSLNSLNGNNMLFGDAGNDTILMGKGTGVADGGTGNDTFNLYSSHHGAWTIAGGAGDDRVNGHGNISDMKIDGVEDLYLVGALLISSETFSSFDTVHNFNQGAITFSDSVDFTWSDSYERGNGVATINGSNSNDHIDLRGATGLWDINAGGGDDVVHLDEHHPDNTFLYNPLSGGAGNDTLTGSSSADQIYGDNGNDVLIGTAGNDEMHGGKGRDTFVFTEIHGQTTIDDFAAKGPSHDVIDLSAVKSVNGFDDLIHNHTVQYDGYIVVWFGNNNVILYGVTADDLNASDFHF